MTSLFGSNGTPGLFITLPFHNHQLRSIDLDIIMMHKVNKINQVVKVEQLENKELVGKCYNGELSRKITLIAVFVDCT